MKHFKEFRYQAIQNGFSLMEVLIGIAIFAIGMLALASLQGALTRSSAEAKVRTTEVNIAERIIEEQRGFSLVSGGAFSFASIADVPADTLFFDSEMDRADTGAYMVTQDVTDYYYDLASDVDPALNAFITLDPPPSFSPDYKTIVVTVAWNDDRNFVIDEGTQTTDNLGGGSIQISATISHISVSTALKVTEEKDGDIIAPPISYTPGLNPDIVSLNLGDSKFKESLTPEPKVFRDNLETRFDVVTYAQAGGSASFLRREEFVAVSCECTLKGSGEGKLPTIWAGDEYTEPEFVTKVIGEVNSSVTQSPFCEICCRDHHDVGGSSSGAYDPSLPTTTPNQYDSGNHKHYSSDRTAVAELGDNYVEACRLVRKDGFFRVGQDFRLEGLNTFPEDFLITDVEVSKYSNYITSELYGGLTGIPAVLVADSASYVPKAIALGGVYQLNASAPVVDTAPRGPLTSDLTLSYTNLPTSTGNAIQQLRSRSIYIDNLSPDLRAVIMCIETTSGLEAKRECKSGDVELDQSGSVNILEIIPFFEIQTTFLNDWEKQVTASVEFTVTNQPIKSDNAHSRGKAEKMTDGGDDTVHTRVNRGVSGLSGTDPINDLDNRLPLGAGWPPGDIDIVNGGDTTPPSGEVITGKIVSEVAGLKAASVTVTASEAVCSFISGSGDFTCFVPLGAFGPKMVLETFGKAGKTICISSSHPTLLVVAGLALFGSPSEDVDLTSASGGVPYVLTLTDDPLLCGFVSGG